MSSVGVYHDFISESLVVDAANYGWPGIADIGGMGAQTSPYTSSKGQDGNVANAIYNNNLNLWWLSYWTVSWPAPGDTFYNAGYQAGEYVGELDSGNFVIPQYFILDPEGYNTAASTTSEWSDFLNGWADGLGVYGLKSQAAFYCNQSQYTTYNLGTIGLPAFIAVTPILNNPPSVTGGNVNGYAGYYISCPADNYVNQVAGWGGSYSTVQFTQNTPITCGP